MNRPLPFVLLLVGCTATLPPKETGETTTQNSSTQTTQTTQTTASTIDGEPVGTRVRFVSWNVEGVGRDGSEELDALKDILRRIDADVVGLNEIDEGETQRLRSVAEELGYTTVYVPDSNPFGELRNGVLSRLPVQSTTAWKSATLSSDTRANDMTRWPLEVVVEVDGLPVRFVIQHFKSGFDAADTFRRAVEGARIGQIADHNPDAPLVVIGGDFNAETDESNSPLEWTFTPSGLPSSYALGADLASGLGDGLVNSNFEDLYRLGFEAVEALQPDGRDATRDVSGRRLDYLWVSPSIASRCATQAEVYDARDDASSSLPFAGDAPSREATAQASDHFPIIADIWIHE